MEMDVDVDISCVWLERLRQRDASVVEVIYDRYAGAFFGMALCWTDQRKAEQLIENTFLALWKQAPGWDRSKGGLFSYMLGILMHEARSLNIPLDYPRLITGFGLQRLADRLQPASAAVFTVIFVQELSLAQAADQLGTSPMEMEHRLGEMVHELIQFARQ